MILSYNIPVVLSSDRMRGMKHISDKLNNRIRILALTVLAICLCCVFAACTKAQAESSDETDAVTTDVQNSAETVSEDAAEKYSRWLSDHYSAKVLTREKWLNDLMSTLKLTDGFPTDTNEIFAKAYENGLTASDAAEPYDALTRRYAAETLFRALKYQPRDGQADDLTDADTAMKTLVYYGWFLPNADGCVTPDAPVTDGEYARLIEETERYERLHGKKVLSFGDSIMFGMGNHDSGISDMTAEKYGMIALDYSVSGATFGVSAGRSHIPTQIKSAARIGVHPDIILLDGGTNDMVFVTRGNIAIGYDPKGVNERTFAGGFEYSAYLLDRYWKGVPVIYVRAHDMDASNNVMEQNYGELGLSIAEKWKLECVDIFTDTGFCTEDAVIRDDYTAYKAKLGHSDGIHPTALGYAKFYLPLVADKIDALLK